MNGKARGYSAAVPPVITSRVVDALVICVCLGTYSANQLLWKRVSDNWFVDSYFNDAIAMALLLSLSNLIISVCNRSSEHTFPLFITFGRVFALVFVAATYWELVAPLYLNSVPDPFDLAAYCLGAALYYAGTKFVASASRKVR